MPFNRKAYMKEYMKKHKKTPEGVLEFRKLKIKCKDCPEIATSYAQRIPLCNPCFDSRKQNLVNETKLKKYRERIETNKKEMKEK